MSKTINVLLEGNRNWVADMRARDPEFFDNLAEGQSPEFLWIGCSDSRVPATEITKTTPGSIFVQRNIANQVIHTDSNALSVVYYAVTVLKVKHIIVCGHYGCGGVQAAMSNDKFGFLDNWLMHLKDVYQLHQTELEDIQDEKCKFDKFVELNVQEQVKNLAKVSFIQEAWEKGEFPYIHGWVYGLNDGLISDLGVTINSNAGLDGVYQYR